MRAGTWTLIVVDPGCECCSYVPVRTFRNERVARRDLHDLGDGYVLEFTADEDGEDES